MSRWERLAPLSGIGVLVFVVASTVMFNFYEYLPDPVTVQAHLTEKSGTIEIAADLGLLGAFLLMWFAGSLRVSMRRAEGGQGRLSAVAFGGGIAAGALMVATYCVMWASAVRAGAASGIGNDIAAWAYDLYSAMFGTGVAVGFAVMIAAFTLVTIRTRVMRSWTGYIGGIVTVVLLTPAAYIAMPAALVWVAVISIWMYRTPTAA